MKSDADIRPNSNLHNNNVNGTTNNANTNNSNANVNNHNSSLFSLQRKGTVHDLTQLLIEDCQKVDLISLLFNE